MNQIKAEYPATNRTILTYELEDGTTERFLIHKIKGAQAPAYSVYRLTLGSDSILARVLGTTHAELFIEKVAIPAILVANVAIKSLEIKS